MAQVSKLTVQVQRIAEQQKRKKARAQQQGEFGSKKGVQLPQINRNESVLGTMTRKQAQSSVVLDELSFTEGGQDFGVEKLAGRKQWREETSPDSRQLAVLMEQNQLLKRNLEQTLTLHQTQQKIDFAHSQLQTV